MNKNYLYNKNLHNFYTFKENIENTIYYRGYTTKTKDSEYIWVTSSLEHAKQYSSINKHIYGGKPLIDEYRFKDNEYNLLNLIDYDMDEKLSENELDEFLNSLDIWYNYEYLFDFTEQEIPLSRLINKILSNIIEKYDGLIIKESGYKTIYI